MARAKRVDVSNEKIEIDGNLWADVCGTIASFNDVLEFIYDKKDPLPITKDSNIKLINRLRVAAGLEEKSNV